MEIIQHTDYKIDAPSVVTVGSFDGVHRGHRKIIYNMRKYARAIQGETILITFFPHPREILRGNHTVDLLLTHQEKVKILSRLKMDRVIILNFTKELSQMSAENFFLQYIWKPINLKHFVMGYDHAFGKNRQGNFQFLQSLRQKYSFELDRIGPVTRMGRAVSSSRIRHAIYNRGIQWANRLLGRHFFIRGKVVHGKGRGKKIGFPTANIDTNYESKLIPARGIYVVAVYLPQKGIYKMGAMNIGNNPTFETVQSLNIEVFILDFDEDIYGETIECYFLSYIRPEMKYPGLDELITQISKDVQCARRWLSQKWMERTMDIDRLKMKEANPAIASESAETIIKKIVIEEKYLDSVSYSLA